MYNTMKSKSLLDGADRKMIFRIFRAPDALTHATRRDGRFARIFFLDFCGGAAWKLDRARASRARGP